MALLLSVIVVTLIAGSVQSVDADHLEPGQGIFMDMENVNLIESKGTKYQVYLQVVIRNGDDQLVNVTESTATAAYLDHNLTDHVFDTLMGQKEIVTIDNIKYEKIQYILSPTLEERTIGYYPIFSEITFKFNVEGDALVQMNKKTKDYSLWKIHYCADFADIGHPDGLQCIPVFQVLIPTLTLEPTDVVIQQWTILRELN